MGPAGKEESTGPRELAPTGSLNPPAVTPVPVRGVGAHGEQDTVGAMFQWSAPATIAATNNRGQGRSLAVISFTDEHRERAV